MTDQTCPCRAMDSQQLAYSACCARYIEERLPAPSAEALVRSRYTAFAIGDIDYLVDSLAPESRHDFDRKAITHWSRSSQWLGLEILSTEQGPTGDETGYVEFVAHFTSEGERYSHRERSLFRHDAQNGRWYFLEEANRKNAPLVKGKQAGRNDPCPCGSGKKFKKCCGAAA
jgi:SEC-C motif-containing protein